MTGDIKVVKQVTEKAPAGVDPQLLLAFRYDIAVFERKSEEAERLLGERKVFPPPYPREVVHLSVPRRSSRRRLRYSETRAGIRAR